MLEEAFVARGAVALAAEASGGRLAGYLLGRVVADEGEVLSVAVDPALRRSGTGRRLLATALDAMVAAGAGTVWLEVRASNLPARMMYLDSGFVVAGTRRGYYDQPVEDALILKRHLIA
ncbi:MAG TPA: ribosomal protein S18-alanine N-acetyltransferase [Gemmatimonadales bacterium]|nr:ribosomal protein S18-alanine N-acetyltransferase [Gemmatimonadales bacterium]